MSKVDYSYHISDLAYSIGIYPSTEHTTPRNKSDIIKKSAFYYENAAFDTSWSIENPSLDSNFQISFISGSNFISGLTSHLRNIQKQLDEKNERIKRLEDYTVSLHDKIILLERKINDLGKVECTS